MEQSRLFIAIALSFLVFFLWEVFFVDRDAQVNENNIIKSRLVDNALETPGKAQDAAVREPKMDAVDLDSANRGEHYQKEPRIITINTPLYSVRISEQGAV